MAGRSENPALRLPGQEWPPDPPPTPRRSAPVTVHLAVTVTNSVFFINTLSWQPHAAPLAVLGKVPGIRNPSLGLSLQPPHLANRPPGPFLHPSLSGSVTGPGVSASYASISVTELRGPKSKIKVSAGLRPLQRLQGTVLPAFFSLWWL
ncbi:hypothetical protein J1605_011809 [Eschrichtius robustus]|uniref:Uncharacterized protein n=1 Tax=Eschrichtius robustus TaxID=9764 RepID=A0AB34GJ08_ESCRO|nr:hypothetical protein J1605_011809 [Eschrichtius robustus]